MVQEDVQPDDLKVLFKEGVFLNVEQP